MIIFVGVGQFQFFSWEGTSRTIEHVYLLLWCSPWLFIGCQASTTKKMSKFTTSIPVNIIQRFVTRDFGHTHLLLRNYKFAALDSMAHFVFLWIKLVRRFLRSLRTLVLMKKCLHLLSNKNAKNLAIIRFLLDMLTPANLAHTIKFLCHPCARTSKFCYYLYYINNAFYSSVSSSQAL